MRAQRSRELPVGYWLAYAAAWTAVAAVYMTIFVLQGASTRQALVDVLHNTGSAALLGLAVVWWTDRLGRADRSRTASVVEAFGVALLFSIGWLLAIGLGFTLQGLAREGVWSWRPLSGAAVPWQLFSGLMVFAAVAASGFAARTWNALRVEAERAARAEAHRVRAELEALRARLQPHFLFNTLHSVRAQLEYDPAAAAETLDEFAELLRYALRVNREGVGEATLAEEWAVTQRYIALERLRLDDRLRTRVSLAPASLGCRVPTFLLQPLIENAIRHGIAPRRKGGTIEVSARVQGDMLEVSVADDGPGARAEDLEDARGLGLRTLRERLSVLHPEDGFLEVSTQPESGFRVTIRMPARRAPDRIPHAATQSLEA